MGRVARVALAIGLLLGLVACGDPKAGEKCNNKGEIRITAGVTYECRVVIGETQKNGLGQDLPVARWYKMDAR